MSLEKTLSLYGGLMLFTGGVAILGWGVIDTYEGFLSTRWPTAEGRIVEAYTWSSEGIRTTNYYYTINYSYRVEGEEYVGNKLAFGRFSLTSSKRNAALAVQKYYPNQAVSIAYDPDIHSTSVLEPGVHPGALATICCGLLFMLFSYFWVTRDIGSFFNKPHSTAIPK